MFRRLKNLWELSKYSPRERLEEIQPGVIAKHPLHLEQVIFTKRKQKLAVIIEDKPEEIFPNEPTTS